MRQENDNQSGDTEFKDSVFKERETKWQRRQIEVQHRDKALKEAADVSSFTVADPSDEEAEIQGMNTFSGYDDDPDAEEQSISQ